MIPFGLTHLRQSIDSALSSGPCAAYSGFSTLTRSQLCIAGAAFVLDFQAGWSRLGRAQRPARAQAEKPPAAVEESIYYDDA